MNRKIKTKISPTSGAQKSEWLAENLRLTAFTKKIKEPEKWWDLIISESPSQRITHPFHSENGSFKKGLVQLNIQAMQPELQKIDWLYIPEPDSKNLPNVGSLDEAINDFSTVMKKWLNIADIQINRLAFGAVLIHPVENIVDGYNYISKYLNDIKLDPINSADFLYQINRPRLSKIKGIGDIKINRISKWMVAVMQRIEITFNGQILSTMPVEKEPQTACRLEIDINTGPEYKGELPNNKTKSLFDYLITLGLEIAEKGDVK